jgi:hypothetical protein
MKFNVNESVRVKLTDEGRAILRRNHDELYAMLPSHVRQEYPYTPPKENMWGYVEFQMWQLMKEFGPHISMGSLVPFETEIEIIER